MERIKAYIVGEKIMSNSSEAKNLYVKSRFGGILEDKVNFSFTEALYLAKKGKLEIFKNKKKIDIEAFIRLAEKKEKNFFVKYTVYKDLRDKGYIVKTALKFGADFRVYDKGKKPGEEHAKWIVYPVYESSSLTWHEFSAKNRIAHSTKKNLLIAIVDDEGDVIYYDIRWLKL